MKYQTRRTIKNVKFYARRLVGLIMIIHGVITWAFMGYALNAHYALGRELDQPGIFACFFVLSMMEWMGGLYVWFLPRYSARIQAMSDKYLRRTGAL